MYITYILKIRMLVLIGKPHVGIILLAGAQTEDCATCNARDYEFLYHRNYMFQLSKYSNFTVQFSRLKVMR